MGLDLNSRCTVHVVSRVVEFSMLRQAQEIKFKELLKQNERIFLGWKQNWQQ